LLNGEITPVPDEECKGNRGIFVNIKKLITFIQVFVYDRGSSI